MKKNEAKLPDHFYDSFIIHASNHFNFMKNE